MSKDHLRKEDPARSAPNRDWQEMLREAKPKHAANGAHLNGKNHAAENGAQDPSWDDAITHAVNLGYQIVDEQIAQGKRVAEEIATRSYTTNSVGSDITEFMQRILQFYTDIGSTCFELVETVSRSTIFQDSMRGFVANEPAKPAPAPSTNGYQSNPQQTRTPVNVPVEVVSALPARITLNIDGPVSDTKLGLHSLVALDPAKPPLRDSRFHYSTANAVPTLRIRVPPGQAPGTYTGVVIDLANNQPRGTLTVQISDEGQESN